MSVCERMSVSVCRCELMRLYVSANVHIFVSVYLSGAYECVLECINVHV